MVDYKMNKLYEEGQKLLESKEELILLSKSIQEYFDEYKTI